MTKVKRDWERNAPPLSRRLREIQEEEWKHELDDFLARNGYNDKDLEQETPDYKWRG